jgi:hypothetical protein
MLLCHHHSWNPFSTEAQRLGTARLAFLIPHILQFHDLSTSPGVKIPSQVGHMLFQTCMYGQTGALSCGWCVSSTSRPMATPEIFEHSPMTVRCLISKLSYPSSLLSTPLPPLEDHPRLQCFCEVRGHLHSRWGSLAPTTSTTTPSSALYPCSRRSAARFKLSPGRRFLPILLSCVVLSPTSSANLPRR